MSPRTKEQFEEIRENSRNKILAVALEQFAERGYKSTSIARIASEAKVSKGLLYNYWTSKEELLLDVLQRQIIHVEQLYPYFRENLPPREFLTRYLHDTFKYLHSEQRTWRLLYSLMLQPDVAVLIKPLIEDIKEGYLQYFTKCFAALNFEQPAAVNLLFQAIIDGVMIGSIIAGDTMFTGDMGTEYLIKEMERIFIHQNERDS